MRRLAMIARWKPVHIGHAAVLRGLARHAAHCWIGIGSSNRYDCANPFTPAETREMIRLVVPGADNLTIFEIPDFNDGPRWRDHLVRLLGPLDAFVTANPYVRDLMSERYRVIHPVYFVSPDERHRVDGTMVRQAMLDGLSWEHLVPPVVAEYLKSRALVTRFRREFRGHAPDPRAPMACHAM